MLTDYIVIGALLYFFLKGWLNGLLRSLTGPLSMAAGCVMGYMYYQKTQNLTIGLLICLFSPFVLNFLITALLKLWHKAINDKAPPPLLSSLLGSAVGILWGGSYIVILLILIGIAPVRFQWFDKVHGNVTASKSYTLLNQWTENKVPATSFDIKKLNTILQDPAKIEQYQSTAEFKALVEDRRLMELVSDEEIVELIQDKNYIRLLSNPKMQSVFQDKELLGKMFALNKRIMEAEPGEEEGVEK